MLSFLFFVLLSIGLVSSVRGSLADKSQRKPGPYTVFKTEPLFVPSAIKITKITPNRDLLSPGYIFIAPHLGANGFGPQIIDDDGNLVWYGNLNVVDIKGRRPYAMDLAVCDYQGSIGTHLSWSEGRPNNAVDQGLKAGGANRIFNNHYEAVADELADFGRLQPPNPHEFNVLPGGESFLQSVYQDRKMDLRPYSGLKDGWVSDGCFQEVDIRDKRELFHWCFLDHYPLWETYMYLHTKANKVNTSSFTSGRGTYGNKWDFMHLNAVDKNEEGDYIVSGRHLSQIVKVAGQHSLSGKKPGTVIWRLSGKHSDFEMEEDARFGRQHHCRFVSTGPEETVISVFNNADDGVTEPTRDMSSGLLIRLNNVTWKATVEAIYENPDKKLSFAQGSMQLQPNGNIHVGWGSNPEWSEFSPNGTLLAHGKAYVASGQLTNYRSFKFPWVGQPRTDPKLVAYCETCNMFDTSLWSSKGEKKKELSPLTAYVSWNGATEVASWRFFVSGKDRKGPWIPAGTFPREGFETKALLSSDSFVNLATFASWVSVEALDKDNNLLGGTTSRTFVPNNSIKEKCDEAGCNKEFRFNYAPKFSRSGSCTIEVDLLPLLVGLAVILVWLECCDGLYNGFMTNLMSRRTGKAMGIYLTLSEGQTFRDGFDKG